MGGSGGFREEFWIHLFPVGPHFHPFIQLLKRRSVSEQRNGGHCIHQRRQALKMTLTYFTRVDRACRRAG